MSVHERSKNIMAQGMTGTNSKRYTQYTGSHPYYVLKADKCYVWGTTGKKYIDFVSGLGSIILGYNHPKVVEAVEKQLKTGVITSSMPSPLEVDLAEMLSTMIPCAERIRFLKTGSEACTAAVRISRAHTNCQNVYTDGHHGWHDIFTSLTHPAIGVKDRFRIRQLDNEELEWPACVIVEPVKLDISSERMRELIDLRERCTRLKAVLVFDEVITGGRMPKFCVANHLSVQPDIIILGKGIASGFPLAIVAGKKEIMNQKDYFVSSTFSGEAISLAAAQATLLELKAKSLKDLMFYGDRLRTKLNELDPDIRFEGYGTRAMLNITHPKTALFMQEAAKAGLIFGKAWFYTFAHMEENVEEYVMNVCGDVITKMRSGRARMMGEVPRETFTR